MRSRAVLDTLTALILVVWLNVVGSLLLPRFAEADLPSQTCGPNIYRCVPSGNGCTGCSSSGMNGQCIAMTNFTCSNKPNLCANPELCSCNPLACQP